jgi:hypothetical protein
MTSKPRFDATSTTGMRKWGPDVSQGDRIVPNEPPFFSFCMEFDRGKLRSDC